VVKVTHKSFIVVIDCDITRHVEHVCAMAPFFPRFICMSDVAEP